MSKITDTYEYSETAAASPIATPEINRYASSLLKRSIDIIFAFVGSLILLILLVPISIAILMSSRGSILFKQARLGINGEPFTVLKFRTMRLPTDGETWNGRTSNSDPRVTLVGNFLRKTYLDELPQFLNVLNGSMSLVGPRPEIPMLAESIATQHPRFKNRLLVKPGITGPAQLYYKHAVNERDAWRRYYYDSFYIRECSFLLDVRLILSTVKRVARHRGQ